MKEEKSGSAVGETSRWLLLIHQIPPKPDYLRVKIWRRLQSLGAVPIKNSVYVLPNADQSHEDFQWILREIVAGGGEGMVCEANLIEGLSDGEVAGLFRKARNADYAAITEGAKRLAKMISGARKDGKGRTKAVTQLIRLKRHFAEIQTIDFFSAAERPNAEAALSNLAAAVRGKQPHPPKSTKSRSSQVLEPYRDCIWVTRHGIHVDRMASAWLIRRFINPNAEFKFVAPQGYRPQPGEIRFDMFDAEFTHEGDKCTFEVFRDRLGLTDPALRPLGEIVHDIDLKDSKFGRQEAVGIGRLIAGIALAYQEDEVRLPRGLAVFEDLYQYFSKHREDSPVA